ncbi:MAG TPA: hypothetical protein DCX22_01770 [Dehalococcoidia bacterium]|nr:hypothetical protein [Dehalococcoidia bacterium]
MKMLKRIFSKHNLSLGIVVLALIVAFAGFNCGPGDLGASGASGGGCSGSPVAQGWSGFTGGDGIVYLGTMKGKVAAIKPATRTSGVDVAFPGQGEWYYSIQVTAPASLCGGGGCASQPLSSPVYSTPQIDADNVYVATYGGKLYALYRYPQSATKMSYRWVYPKEGDPAMGAIVGNLVLDNGVLYFGSSDGKLYAITTNELQFKWEFQTGGKIWTTPVVKDGVVYVGSYDGSLYAVSAKDGSQLWSQKLKTGMASSPVISGDMLYIGTFDNSLYALSTADGREKWRVQGGNWFWATPVVVDDIIYAACLDKRVYAFDAATGRELWRFETVSPVPSRPVFVNGLLTGVSESGELFILDGKTGQIKNTINLNAAVVAPLYAEGNTVYVHSKTRYAYAVDVQTGQIAWKLSLDIESK